MSIQCSKNYALKVTAAFPEPLAYYNMDAFVGGFNAEDAIAGRNLEDNGGTFALIAGLIGNAFHFTSSGAAIRVINPANNAGLEFGQGSWTVRMWVYPVAAAYSSTQLILRNSLGPQGGWEIYTNGGSHNVRFSFKKTTAGFLDINVGDVEPVNVWHRIIVGYDANSGNAFTKLDNNSTITQASAPMASTVGWLGLYVNSGANEQMRRFDEIALWKGQALTEAQMLEDWNGGAGRTWPW